MKFRKRPVVVEATQWFKNGDHDMVFPFNPPDDPNICSSCGKKLAEHGSVLTLEGSHIVCPSDWVIRGIKGELYPCKDEIFKMTYDPCVEFDIKPDRGLHEVADAIATGILNIVKEAQK